MAKNIPPALAFLAPPPDSCAPDDVGGSVPSLVLPLDRSWSWSSASLDQEDDSPSAIESELTMTDNLSLKVSS